MSDVTEANVGKMFSVPWSPNPHKLVFLRPHHCQMHGEFIGMSAGFRKKRNSETKPWGGAVSVINADNPDLVLWDGIFAP